jgi:hypothetical protein
MRREMWFCRAVMLQKTWQRFRMRQVQPTAPGNQQFARGRWNVIGYHHRGTCLRRRFRRHQAGGASTNNQNAQALRSSNSIATFSGPRRKQMRMPGRIAVGSMVKSAPLAFNSATT